MDDAVASLQEIITTGFVERDKNIYKSEKLITVQQLVTRSAVPKPST
jgi:hypothetical protein